jgi:hypothetical protein
MIEVATRHLSQSLPIIELLFTYRTFIEALFCMIFIEDDLLEFADLLNASGRCSVPVLIYPSQVLQDVVHVGILEHISIVKGKDWTWPVVNEPTLLNSSCEIPWPLVPHFIWNITHRTVFRCDLLAKITVALRAFNILCRRIKLKFALMTPQFNRLSQTFHLNI